MQKSAVHGVAESQTRLSDFTLTFHLGNGNPLQYSCLENPRDGGAWWAAIYGVAQSRTRLKWLSSSSSNQNLSCLFHVQKSTGWLKILFRNLSESESEATQSCPTICDAMNCSLSGSSVHGVFQARVLEWVAVPFSRGSSRPRDWTWVSCIAGKFFTIWAIRETDKCRCDRCAFPLKNKNKTKTWLCFPIRPNSLDSLSLCETFSLLLCLKAKCGIQKRKKTQGQCKKALEFQGTFRKVP